MAERIDLPPAARGVPGLRFSAGAARGVFELPVCEDCGAQQYPPRERCVRCLSERLVWREVAAAGELLALTKLHHSNERFFASRLPRRVGLVRLEGGAVAVVHVAGDVAPGERVALTARLDRAGEGVIVAQLQGAGHLDEGLMDEFTYPLQGRRVAIAGPVSAYREAILKQVLAAGAAEVVLIAGDDSATEDPRLRVVSASARGGQRRLAQSVGPVERLIHAPSFAEPAEVGSLAQAVARAVDEPLALIQALRPSLVEHGGAVVQVLSIFGRCYFPALGAQCVPAAAAVSATQGLRASLQPEGVRVLTVFCGPAVGGPALPLPAAAPQRVAQAVVRALDEGREESYADPVAQDVAEQLREDPELAARNLAAMSRG
jgi:uncharacterized OB-fold protein